MPLAKWSSTCCTWRCGGHSRLTEEGDGGIGGYAGEGERIKGENRKEVNESGGRDSEQFREIR